MRSQSPEEVGQSLVGAGLFVFMVLGIVTLAVAAFYLGYEFYALFTGRKLITTHVREAYQKYPPMGFLAGLGAGLLLGHFFWQ